MRRLFKWVSDFDIGAAPLWLVLVALFLTAIGFLYLIDMRSSVGLAFLGALTILLFQKFLRWNKRTTILSVIIAVVVTVGVAAYSELKQIQLEQDERQTLSIYTSRFFTNIMCDRAPGFPPHYEFVQSDDESKAWFNKYVYLQHKLDALREYLLSTKLPDREKRVTLTAIHYSQYYAKTSGYTGLHWFPTSYSYYEELMERFVIVGLLDSVAVDCSAPVPAIR